MSKELSDFVHFVYQAVIMVFSSGFALGLINYLTNRLREHREAESLAHDKRFTEFDTRLKVTEASNQKLINELEICKKHLQIADNNISSTGTDIKSTLEKVKTAIVERLEKDEGDIKVLDEKVQKIGKVILKP